MPLIPGTRIGGYQIVTAIGSGGMGEAAQTFPYYIRGFPDGEHQLRVSPEGGDNPRWRRDGRELFFYNNGKMMAAAVRASENGVEITSVTPLFDCRPPDGFNRPFYDVTPDGRFLMMTAEGDPAPTPLTLIVNWQDLLRSSR